MSGKAAKIVLTEMQKSELENISRSKVAQQRCIQRARIILLAAAGLLNSEISSRVGIGRQQVGLWRRRWQQSQEALLTVELNENRADPISDRPDLGQTRSRTGKVSPPPSPD